MNIQKLVKVFQQAGRKYALIGDNQNGVLIALDIEGRLFTYLNGVVLNRVNESAIAHSSHLSNYYNPGGDTLWPAPEGTTLGYQYATGDWRVPASLRFTNYQVNNKEANRISIAAEVDLINNKGAGIPTLFERFIEVESKLDEVVLHVKESITYLGKRELQHGEFLIAPWSLCQFDCGPGCEVVFPSEKKDCFWDLYEDAFAPKLLIKDGIGSLLTEGSERFQIGLGSEVPWIAYRDPRRGLEVTRTANPIGLNQSYIDIRDTNPGINPDPRGVKYSVYADSNGFMEIEAVGGCPSILRQGQQLAFTMSTRYHQ